MEALILNREFQTQAIIDAFESFIWVDRYNTPGDFEIYMPIAKAPLEYIKRDYYIWIEESDRLQVIEDITITTDAEDGDHITFTGRTLESFLDRRVVYSRTIIDGPLQDGIKQLLDENAISPGDDSRKIPGLRFVWNNDPRISELTMNGSFLGETLLDILETYCQLNDLGFKIVYNEEDDCFDFSLYFGEDRSYDQEHNPWVVFSAAYDNLIGSNYFESYAGLKTAAVIAGSESDDRGQEIVDVDGRPAMMGLDRREMYVDGSGIEWPEVEVNEESIRKRYMKPNTDEYYSPEKKNMADRAVERAYEQAEAQSREDFRAQLRQLGYEELATTYITESFEGEIEARIQYIYGRDFYIGDVVQVRNRYGKEASSRITEVMRVHDTSGESLTPTFTTLIGKDNKGDIENPDLD